MGDVVHVEVAWETDPFTRPTDPDWTRLGTVDPEVKIESLRTSRGSNIRTGEIETGSATAVIGDQNGNLDPSNALSEWAPNVLPRRRVRFVLEHTDADVYEDTYGDEYEGPFEAVVWTGFIQNLPIRWRKEIQQTTLTASGIFWLLADTALPPSVLHVETLDLAPDHYWPMVETSGGIAEDIAGELDGTWSRPVTQAAALVPFDQRGCTLLQQAAKEGQALGQTATVDGFTAGSEITGSLWWRWASETGVLFEARRVFKLTDVAGVVDATYVSLAVWPGSDSTSARLYVTIQDISGGGDLILWTEEKPIRDGQPHHFAFTLTSAEDLHIYLDGVEWTYEIVSGFPTAAWTSVNVGNVLAAVRVLQFGWGDSGGYDEPTTTCMGHVTYWDRELSAEEIATIYAAGTNPWAGDLTGARLNRILDVAGVDADDRDIASGTQTCGPTALDGGSLMNYVRRIAQTEGGPIGETADGKIFLRERTANDPTLVATFSDDPDGDGGSAVEPLDPDYSLDRVVNIARVTRENTATQEAVHAASLATYGPKTVSLDTLHQSPSGSRSAAARLTIRNHDPRLVFPQVVANSIDTPTGVLTDMDIGDAASVIARPPRGGDPIEQTSIVERIEHGFEGYGRWKATFGVAEHTVLPDFWWDEPGQGWDESVWVAP